MTNRSENTITKEDVLQVVDILKMKTPSDDVIQEIIDEYPFEQEEDPSATWNLVVEKQLYDKMDDEEL